MTKLFNGEVIPDGQYLLEKMILGGLAVDKDSRLWIKRYASFDPKGFNWVAFSDGLPYPGLNLKSRHVTSAELWAKHHAKPLYHV